MNATTRPTRARKVTTGRNGNRPVPSGPNGASLPHDEMTERAVLGTLFEAANEGAHVVKPMVARLRPASFHDLRHRAIFEAMQRALDAGQTCDQLTVRSILAGAKQLANVGGDGYLIKVANDALPRIGFDQHCGKLAQLESLRLAFDECVRLQRGIANPDPAGALAAIANAPDRFHYFHTLASGAQADDGVIRPDPEPWPEAVSTAALLEELTSIYRGFVILPEHGPEALALWTLHTYVFEQGDFSPILALISPEKRCGKSTTLKLANCLARRPLLTSNVSPAALYRTTEEHKPTLLIDEFDSIADPNRKEDTRNLMNAGHERNGKVIRCEGDDNKPRAYRVFGPKMVGSIGDLPDTLMDRAIKLPMRRKLPGEAVDRLRRFDAPETRRRCLRWARDNAAAIATAKPYLPAELNDRAQDNWEPLLAIAELAGEDWANRAREAALALSGETAQGTHSLGVELLHDIDRAFAEAPASRLTTKDLIDALKAMEERPWASYGFGKGISPHNLAKLLKPFGVNSRTIRFGDDSTAKGYYRDDLQDALERYPLARPTPENTVTA